MTNICQVVFLGSKIFFIQQDLDHIISCERRPDRTPMSSFFFQDNCEFKPKTRLDQVHLIPYEERNPNITTITGYNFHIKILLYPLPNRLLRVHLKSEYIYITPVVSKIECTSHIQQLSTDIQYYQLKLLLTIYRKIRETERERVL